MQNMTIVGGGTMGCSLALAFARAGKHVTLVSRSEDTLAKAETWIAGAAATLVDEGLIDAPASKRIAASVAMTTDLVAGVRKVPWVLEAIPERLESKRGLFTDIEQMVSETTRITTTTSSLAIADIASGMRRPERAMTTHFVNPPHLVPVVEVVAHPSTSADHLQAVLDDLRASSFAPVLLKRDIEGFIANRLQGALFREALHLMAEDVADAEAIDTVVREGLGMRWAFMGPMETADFGGLDTWALVSRLLAPHLATSSPLSVLEAKADAGQLGVKTGQGFYSYEGVTAAELLQRRDRQLIGLLKLRRGRPD